MPLPSVCVFCGSRPGDTPAFTTQAEMLGQGLAGAGWRLVYGAGDVGLMGSVARAAQSAGGATFGVIPQHLVDWEVGKTDLTTYVVTETMHERKKVMFMNCDAVVVMPGGAGSLLIGLLDHVVARGFADESLLGFVQAVPDAAAAIEALRGTLGTAG